jgi:hypothetical protein
LPDPTFTPGLTFAAALTELLAMSTLAPTSTFGSTLRFRARPDGVDDEGEELPVEGEALDGDVEVEGVEGEVAPDGLVAPDDVGVFTITPGLMLAPAFTSLLAMPTFAFTPTFGFTLVLEPEGDVPPETLDWVEPAPWRATALLPSIVLDWFAVTSLVTVCDESGAMQPLGRVFAGGLVHAGGVAACANEGAVAPRAAASARVDAKRARIMANSPW